MNDIKSKPLNSSDVAAIKSKLELLRSASELVPTAANGWLDQKKLQEVFDALIDDVRRDVGVIEGAPKRVTSASF